MIRNTQNFVLEVKDFEPRNTLPSETVPNEALTPREIIEKYAKGAGAQIEAIQRNAVYGGGDFDSPDYDELNRLQGVERAQRIAETKQQVKAWEDEIEQEKRQQEAQAAAKKLTQKEEKSNKSSSSKTTGKTSGSAAATSGDKAHPRDDRRSEE